MDRTFNMCKTRYVCVNLRQKQKNLLFQVFLEVLFVLLLVPAPLLFAKDDVRISILAVNPTDNRIEASVTHYLPPEIKPEDIIDRSTFEVKYDQDKQVYYLSGKVPLAPKETQTLGIKVKNVWKIPEEQTTSILEKAAQNLAALEGTAYYDTAKLLRDKIAEKITAMGEESVKTSGVRRRIELYRAQTKQLDDLQKDVLSLDSMRRLKDEQEGGVRTAKFIITAENPSNEPKKMIVRSSLPKEIGPEDVLDKLDFLLLYDSDKEKYALEKEDNLQPKEKKKYEILLRDIWYVPQEILDTAKRQKEALLGYLRGSPYENFSVQQADFISSSLSAIEALQSEVAGTTVIEERIRAYSLNRSRMELVNRRLKDLQDLLLEIPLKRQESTVDQIKKAIRSLANVIDIIKLGFKPDLSTTWWIILGIIAFLMIMSASFYVIWVSKLKETKAAKKGERGKTPTAEKPAAKTG